MNSRLVAVTQRIDFVSDYNEQRDSVDQKLVQWVVDAGFVPVLVPNSLFELGELQSWIQHVKPQALLLSGGNNIGDCPDRDATEFSLLDWAKENKCPVLGICRGMQMMAVWAGTDLVPVTGHIGVKHSFLIDGYPTEVNSYHDFAVIKCPDEFVEVIKLENGVLEAMHHVSLPWEAWMWHPEREIKFCLEDTRRLQSLFTGGNDS